MIVISGGDGDDSWSGFLEKLWVVCPPNLPCARDDNAGVVSQEKPESKMIASITGLYINNNNNNNSHCGSK